MIMSEVRVLCLPPGRIMEISKIKRKFLFGFFANSPRYIVVDKKHIIYETLQDGAMVAQQNHNLNVGGSNPPPATIIGGFYDNRQNNEM